MYTGAYVIDRTKDYPTLLHQRAFGNREMLHVEAWDLQYSGHNEL
jgi:hypothetical protein